MRQYRIFFATVALLFMTFCYSASLQLSNDSMFTLDAVIIDANGKVIGKTTVEPHTFIIWESDQKFDLQYANKSSVPYTVIWYCHQSGKEYGLWTGASPGSRITAQLSDGPKICKIKNEKKFLEEHIPNQNVRSYSDFGEPEEDKKADSLSTPSKEEKTSSQSSKNTMQIITNTPNHRHKEARSRVYQNIRTYNNRGDKLKKKSP